MIRLFEMDLKDYNSNDKVFSRPSSRAIIISNDNKIALVYSEKEGYYKFPGGGIQNGEDKRVALIREVKEEVGLVVVPESIREFGSVMRRQKSNITPNTIFEQENFYYLCDVNTHIVDQNLDDYEKKAGFVLKFVDIDEAIRINSLYQNKNIMEDIMIKRETKVLQMIKNKIFK